MRAKAPPKVLASARTNRVLPSPGTPSKQHMAAREQRHEHVLDDLSLADQRAADLLGDTREDGAGRFVLGYD